MNDLPYLIDRWRFMRRAAESPDFEPYRARYTAYADGYALVIRARWRALLEGYRG